MTDQTIRDTSAQAVDGGVLYLRPRRRPMLLISFAGLVVAAIGVVTTTVFLITLGVIAAVGAGLSLVPGLAYLKLDEQGFQVKKIGKRWGAAWIEVERFEATKVLRVATRHRSSRCTTARASAGGTCRRARSEGRSASASGTSSSATD